MEESGWDQQRLSARVNASRQTFLPASLRFTGRIEKVRVASSRVSPLILSIILLVTGLHTYQLIQQTTGGSDLLGSDIPKSIMLLKGQDPYSVHPWSAPYPPLLLIIVAGIIRITSINLLHSPSALQIIGQNIRVVGLFADALVSIIIFLALRFRGLSGIQALIPAGLFVTLPAINTAQQYWFHSDTFGYPILALSLLALTLGRYFTGTTLLAIATIYKVHPILALPLILVWLGRKHGLRPTLPILLTSATIVALGLVLPFELPGYAKAILGFNLANTGNGTNTFSILNLLYGILPTLGVTISTTTANQIWLGTTAALFTIITGIVWRHANTIDPVPIVLLGLTAWLIPLKLLFTNYVVWALIPILMLGRLRTTIFLASILQIADTMAYWSYFPAHSPIPGLGSVYGFFLTAVAYCLLSVGAMRTALKIRSTKALVHSVTNPSLRM